MTNTTTTNTKPLYLHDDGTSACADTRCGGATLHSEVKNRPDGLTYRTPRGTWTRVTARDVAYAAKEFGYTITCETCGAAARVGD